MQDVKSRVTVIELFSKITPSVFNSPSETNSVHQRKLSTNSTHQTTATTLDRYAQEQKCIMITLATILIITTFLIIGAVLGIIPAVLLTRKGKKTEEGTLQRTGNGTFGKDRNDGGKRCNFVG